MAARGSGVFQFTGNMPVAKQEVKSTEWYLQAKKEEARTIAAATNLLSQTRLKTDGLAPADAPAANAMGKQIKSKRDKTMDYLRGDGRITTQVAASIAKDFEYKKDVQTGLKEAFINAEKRSKYLDRLEQMAVSTGRWEYADKVREAVDSEWGGTFNPDGTTNEFKPGAVAKFVDVDTLIGKRLAIAQGNMERSSKSGFNASDLKTAMSKAELVPGSNKMAYTYDVGKDVFTNYNAIDKSKKQLIAEMNDPETEVGAYLELMGPEERKAVLDKLGGVAESYKRIDYKPSSVKVGTLTTPKVGNSNTSMYDNNNKVTTNRVLGRSKTSTSSPDSFKSGTYNPKVSNSQGYELNSTVFGKPFVSVDEIGDFFSTIDNSELTANNPTFNNYLNNGRYSSRAYKTRQSVINTLRSLENTRYKDGELFDKTQVGYTDRMTPEQVELMDDLNETISDSYNAFTASPEGRIQLSGIQVNFNRTDDNGNDHNLQNDWLLKSASETQFPIFKVNVGPEGTLGSATIERGGVDSDNNPIYLNNHREFKQMAEGSGGENHLTPLSTTIYAGRDLIKIMGDQQVINENSEYAIVQGAGDDGPVMYIKEIQAGELQQRADVINQSNGGLAVEVTTKDGTHEAAGSIKEHTRNLQNGESYTLPLNEGGAIKVTRSGDEYLAVTMDERGNKTDVEVLQLGYLGVAQLVADRYMLHAQYKQ